MRTIEIPDSDKVTITSVYADIRHKCNHSSSRIFTDGNLLPGWNVCFFCLNKRRIIYKNARIQARMDAEGKGWE